MHASPVLTIDLVSDLVSPWCYLAQRRLDRALASVDGVCVPRIRWQPFEINPDIGRSGMAVDTYLASVFGSAAAGWDVLEDVRVAGEDEGIAFDFRRVATVPNTMAAHRLVLLAEEQGRGEAVAGALFRGFFEEGRDIGDLEVLTEMAAGAGFDPAQTRQYLISDRNRDAVRARQAQVQGAGLNGVPGIVVNGRYAVMGVPEPEVLVAAMDRALFEGVDPQKGAVH